MAKPYRRKDSPYWWIAPMMDGVQRPRSSQTTDYQAACDELKRIEGKIADGAPITARTGRVLLDELLDDVVTRYKIQRRITDDNDPDLKRSLLCRLKHIRPLLGHLRVGQIKQSHIHQYILRRQEKGASNGTINRELAEIRKAFNMGYPEKVLSKPKFEMLPETNERDGYFEPAQFQSIVRHCNPLAGVILTVAYITGWRIRSIIRLEWRQVDLSRGFVWLNAGETKNDLAVKWPLVAGLQELFEERRRVTDDVEKRKAMVIPWVFHRNGKRAKSIRTAWEKARIDAGLPGRVIHDFRGTATVNLLEAGVDLPKVMGMIGFKSIQMVARYARKRGLRESSLLEVGKLLEGRIGTTKVTPEKAKAAKE